MTIHKQFFSIFDDIFQGFLYPQSCVKSIYFELERAQGSIFQFGNCFFIQKIDYDLKMMSQLLDISCTFFLFNIKHFPNISCILKQNS